MSNIKEVAKKANVSIGTVSNAFKRPEKVAPDTRDRILEISRALNYYPNQLASALVTSKTHLLGLLVSYAYSSSRGMAVNEFVRAAAQRGYTVIMTSMDMNVEEEEEQINRFVQYQVDGVVVYSDYVEGRTSYIRKLVEKQVPCVVVKRYDSAYENISISADAAFKMMVEQIKRYQHRRIGAIVRSLNLSDGTPSIRRHRLNTLQCELKKVGLELREEDIVVVEKDDLNSGRQAVDYWLASGRQLPTVFCCMYDHLAVGVMTRLRERGYSVPGDVSVIGYGNYEVGEYCSPRLATVALNETEILQKAFEMIMERIDNPTIPLRNVVIDHTFIFRESLGAALKES